MRRKLTIEEKQYIFDNYKTNTPVEIARHIKCNASTVYSFIANNSLSDFKRINHPPITCKERKVILEKYRDVPIREIALLLDRPASGIYSFLRREKLSKKVD